MPLLRIFLSFSFVSEIESYCPGALTLKLTNHCPGAFYSEIGNCRDIPVILDAEKDRPHLKDLLPLADYIICNRHFPEAFTGR